MVFASEDFSDLDEFGKFKMPKAFRKVGAFTAGSFTLGLIKPKAFGIKSRSGMQAFRVGRVVGIAGATIAGAMLLPGAVGPALSSMGKILPSIGGLRRPRGGPTEDQPIPPGESPLVAGVLPAGGPVAPVQAAMAGLGPIAIVGGTLLLGFMLLGGKK